MESVAVESAAASVIGTAMHDLVAELYPLPRSITGDGLRATLRRLQECIPLVIREVPTGTEVLDWTVPDEWNLHDAYVKNEHGERVIDFQESNLHVVNYSAPIHARMSLSELRPHLHTLPDRPDWLPYRTAYYDDEAWGFCLRHNTLEALEEGEYEVCVDATLAPGSLSYGELLIPGATEDEVLISAHACHPSLANDNLSGIAVAVFLARELLNQPLHYSYRFLFAPGTIGAITWLAQNEDRVHRIRHGLVLATLGDAGAVHYKKSRRGTLDGQGTTVDRAAAHVLAHCDQCSEIRDFTPFGYDERQFGAPGFNLPVGRLTRTPHGEYPEYHTSADDLALVTPASLVESLTVVREIVGVLENNRRYRNTRPKGEPQLGRRGLYHTLGGHPNADEQQKAMLWVLNFSDGHHALLDIAERAGLPFAVVRGAADRLRDHGLLIPSPNVTPHYAP